MGRLLRKLGLSPQRPLYRAWQQNPEPVARWKAEQYPQIRAEAAQVGATIWFADEAGSAPTTTRPPPGRRSGTRRWWRPPAAVFLVLDGHPVHRSGAVKQFAEATAGGLRLFFLPGYSPELNPS